MRFKELEIGDYFIAMPNGDDIGYDPDSDSARAQAFVVFRKISDIRLSGPIDAYVHNSGTAFRVQTGQHSEMPQTMPVLKVLL